MSLTGNNPHPQKVADNFQTRYKDLKMFKALFRDIFLQYTFFLNNLIELIFSSEIV